MNLTPDIVDEEGKGILFARVASKLLNEGKIDQATLISEVGIKKFPSYAQGHFVLGKCYQEKDMYEEARAEYERVLRFDSSHLAAIKELAGLYQSTGLNDVYKDYLFRMLTLDPLNAKVLEECREQGVYELWKSQNDQIEFEKPDLEKEEDLPDLSLDEEKPEDTKSEETKQKEEDLLKIDLNQFQNQDDDFTTIMDGLIQESGDDSQEVDAANYLQDLETPDDIESELLAEEKPIEESIDDLDLFEREDLQDESNSSFLELDYSKKQEKENEEDEQVKNEDAEDDVELLSLEDEINQEPEEVEEAFSEPKTKLEDSETTEEVEQNNAHEKTELFFAKKEKNIEFQFDNENIKEPGEKTSDLKMDTEEKSNEKVTSDPELILDSESAKDTSTKSGDQNEQSENQILEQADNNNDSEVISDEETVEEKDSDEHNTYVKQKIVSQTLGEILVSQHKYKEAKQVFLALKKQQPNNPNIDKKLEILNKIILLEEKKE